MTCKASSEYPNGSVEGYLSTFDNIDSDGDVIRRGAWAKSARERFSNGDGVPLMKRHFAHGGGAEDVIGTIMQAKEDEKGLYIVGAFSADRSSQEIRERVQGRHIRYMSAGFRVIGYNHDVPHESGAKVNEFTELALVEGTITPRPANTHAIIMRAKALRDSASAIDSPRLASLIDEIENLIDTFCAYGAEGNETDPSHSRAKERPVAEKPTVAKTLAEWMDLEIALSKARARICEVVAGI